MVPLAKKRKLPSNAAPDAKRSKKNGPLKPTKGKAAKRGSGSGNNNKTSSKRRAVDADALSWQHVGLEEFGDLQFIEDVDVVRDGGKIQFLVAENCQAETTNESNTKDEEEDEGESFEGFGDDAVEGRRVDSDEAGDSQVDLEGEKLKEEATGKDKQPKQKQSQKQKGQKVEQDKQQQQLAVAGTKKKVQEPAAHQSISGNENGNGNGNSFGALGDLADAEEEDGPDGDVAAWVPLNLSTRMLSAIAKLKFPKPTAIQKKAIPQIVAGEDVIGKAQTGSGKTLAFGIPIVERWLEEQDEREDDGEEEESKATGGKGPMAIVLSPTRELAKQLGDHLKALCDGLPTAPYVCVVTGGLSIHKQHRQLEKADIVIGTPGRLWEVLEGDMKLQDSLTKIRFLVVDEADRLFKAGQFQEAQDILGVLDRRPAEKDGADGDASEDEKDDAVPRQTLVFSATFDKDLQTKLAGKSRLTAGSDEEKMKYLMKSLKFRREPKYIDVNPVGQMAEGLKEGLIECGAMEKDLYLYSVLLLNPNRRTLVFTNSISAVRRLTPLLQNLNLSALPLHSQMAQKARLRSLERFTASPGSILIATDVAARGLDIKDVEQVLHYHVPRAADTYIHRSGRTARADSKGISVILCSPDEVVPTRRLAGKVHAERGRREHVIQTLPLDRKIASRLKPRVELAKRLADAVLAKEKGHGDDAWLRNAADELGVDYDSEELEEAAQRGRHGRGGGRRKKEKEARQVTKAEMGIMRAQLREELGRRVNLGVSERYITGGRVDVGRLLREREQKTVGGLFLGGEGLGLDF